MTCCFLVIRISLLLFTDKRTNLLTAQRRDVLKKATVQLVMKFSAFQQSRRFLTVFITDPHLLLSCPLPLILLLLRSILVMSSHLRLSLPSFAPLLSRDVREDAGTEVRATIEVTLCIWTCLLTYCHPGLIRRP